MKKVNYCNSNFLAVYDENYYLTWVAEREQIPIRISDLDKHELFGSDTCFRVSLIHQKDRQIPIITLGSANGIEYYDSTGGVIIKNVIMPGGWLWSLGDRRFFEYDAVANQLEYATDFIRYSKAELSNPLVHNNVTFHHPSNKLKKMMQEAELFYKSVPMPEPIEESAELRLEHERGMTVRERFEYMTARARKLEEIHRIKRSTFKAYPNEPLITRWYSLQKEQRLNALFNLLGETEWICAWLIDRVMVMSLRIEDTLEKIEKQCKDAGEIFEKVSDDSKMCEDI